MKRRDFLMNAGLTALGLINGKLFGSENEQLYKLEEEAKRLWDELSKKKHNVDDSDVEREMRKHDPWIMDFIGGISFVKQRRSFDGGAFLNSKRQIVIPYSQYDKMDLGYMLHCSGLPKHEEDYLMSAAVKADNPYADIDWSKIPSYPLNLIYSIEKSAVADIPEKKKIFVDALDHELFHALVASDFGLMRSKHYSGPGDAELKKNIVHMLASDRYREPLIRLFRSSSYSGAEYGLLTREGRPVEYLFQNDFEAVSHKFKRYDEILDRNPSVGKDSRVDEVYSTVNEPKIHIPAEAGVDEEEHRFFKKLGKQDFSSLKKRLVLVDTTAEHSEKYFFREMPYLHFAKVNVKEDVVFFVWRSWQAKRLHRDIGIPLSEMMGFLDYAVGKRVQKTLIEEIHARLLDSMYSIHVGERRCPSDVSVPQFHFELEPDIVDMFSRFIYNEEPALKKGVEKYRLALDFKKMSVRPETIKRELEYATSYSFDGKKYFWPENDFRLKAPIPVE